MQQHYFVTPWALAGDLTPGGIPTPADPSGYVSYDQGFTYDYQRNLASDSAAKQIQRVTMNSVLNDVTVYLQDQQQYAIPEFITAANNNNGSGATPFPYDVGAIVRYSSSGSAPFTTYISLITNNTDIPGATGNWYPLQQGLPKSYAGNPNTNVAGVAAANGLPPSIVWDTVNSVIWVCTTTGNAAGAVWSPPFSKANSASYMFATETFSSASSGEISFASFTPPRDGFILVHGNAGTSVTPNANFIVTATGGTVETSGESFVEQNGGIAVTFAVVAVTAGVPVVITGNQTVSGGPGTVYMSMTGIYNPTA